MDLCELLQSNMQGSRVQTRQAVKSCNDSWVLPTTEAKPPVTDLYFIYFWCTSNVLRDRLWLDIISRLGLSCLECYLMEWVLRLGRDLEWIGVRLAPL